MLKWFLIFFAFVVVVSVWLGFVAFDKYNEELTASQILPIQEDSAVIEDVKSKQLDQSSEILEEAAATSDTTKSSSPAFLDEVRSLESFKDYESTAYYKKMRKAGETLFKINVDIEIKFRDMPELKKQLEKVIDSGEELPKRDLLEKIKYTLSDGKLFKDLFFSLINLQLAFRDNTDGSVDNKFARYMLECVEYAVKERMSENLCLNGKIDDLIIRQEGMIAHNEELRKADPDWISKLLEDLYSLCKDQSGELFSYAKQCASLDANKFLFARI